MWEIGLQFISIKTQENFYRNVYIRHLKNLIILLKMQIVLII